MPETRWDRLRRDVDATFAEYRVDRELARGRSAIVYVAEERASGRRVAIKVFHEYLHGSPDDSVRFRREVGMVVGLRHPNIASILQVRDVGGVPAVVVQLVDGRALSGLAHAGEPIPAGAVRTIALDVGSALTHVHERVMVHGRLQPSSIVISADGRAVVVDWPVTSIAATDAIVGNPAYLGPEQLRAELLTGAADQYSVGVMLYELLAGRLPFAGGSMEIVMGHLTGSVPPIRAIRPACPAELESVVLRMLGKTPAARWPSMAHATRALEAVSLEDDEAARTVLTRLASRT